MQGKTYRVESYLFDASLLQKSAFSSVLFQLQQLLSNPENVLLLLRRLFPLLHALPGLPTRLVCVDRTTSL